MLRIQAPSIQLNNRKNHHLISTEQKAVKNCSQVRKCYTKEISLGYFSDVLRFMKQAWNEEIKAQSSNT